RPGGQDRLQQLVRPRQDPSGQGGRHLCQRSRPGRNRGPGAHRRPGGRQLQRQSHAQGRLRRPEEDLGRRPDRRPDPGRLSGQGGQRPGQQAHGDRHPVPAGPVCDHGLRPDRRRPGRDVPDQ
ncbi:hypothetical protein LTR94_034056, partial [Friedmanniomyces endolithicus]